MLVEEESGISDESNNNEKLDNNLVDSISITELNEDASTYMGVRSVAEEQSVIMKKTRKRKAKENKNQNKAQNSKDNSNKKKRRKESFSSVSESKSSESSNDKRNSFTELLEKKGKDEDKRNEEKDQKSKNNENEQKMEKIEEIETTFEWDGSGKLVYVTGSFCDRKKFYIMTKNEKGIFSLTLSLPRGFHQYKFKVDDNWTYSKTYPKYEDNGNVNNFIDTTDYNNLDYNDNNEGKYMKSPEKKEANENNKKDKSKSKKKGEEKEKDKHKKKEKKEKNKREEKPNVEKKRNSSILSVNFLNSLNYYTIYYPLKSEFNEKPLSLPGLYKTCFILNEDFKEQEMRKFAEIEYVNNSNNSMSFASSERSIQSVQSRISILGEVIPYVKFQNLYHIHSNHLHSKLLHSNEYTVINSMTSRYRFKFSTFIYYKPNEPVEPVQRIKHSQTVRISGKKKRNEKTNII